MFMRACLSTHNDCWMNSRPILLESALGAFIRRPYICSSCLSKAKVSTQRASHAALASPFKSLSRRRHNASRILPPKSLPPAPKAVSTTASVTAVNAKKEIPYHAEDLYQSLSALEREAGPYINLSQLRLALRGLESQDAVTRVAILGIEDQVGARRLARVLLADPLAEEAEWERRLVNEDEAYGKALLLRYGEKFDVDDRHPLVKTLSVRSSVLLKNRLEIFVQSIAASNADVDEDSGSMLVPALTTPTSARGRLSTVTYPVHKSLLYANGFGYAASLCRSVATKILEEGEPMVKGIIDGSWNSLRPSISEATSISPINLNLAEVAIESLRKSLSQSPEYSHAWLDSGLPTILTWLCEGTESTSDVKPSVKRLIRDVLSSTTTSISTSETSASLAAKAATVSSQTRDILSQDLSVLAENAHTELRDRLSAAFASRSWNRLKWYKLFFRVDDVSSTLTELLQRAWLFDAEKEMIWTSGRLYQSGLFGGLKSRRENSSVADESITSEAKLGAAPRSMTIQDVLDRDRDIPAFDTPAGLAPLIPQPYPQPIADARARLTNSSIPYMHTLAQSLVLQSLSTTFLSTAISALFYVSISATSAYEAGVVAALGTVWSLRRLQKRWEGARREWKIVLKEEGRGVLKSVEQHFRKLIREGGVVQPDKAGIKERERARDAVERVRYRLKELESDD